MNINTQDVLAAAGQSEFFSFKPGLVGGLHRCDPLFLPKKAQEFGYNPEIILAEKD